MKLKLTIITLAIASVLHLSYVYANDLPELGDVSATVLSPLQEQAIAEQIMRQVAVSPDVIRDPEISDYVESLGNRLASNGPDKRQKFYFFVVQDPTINAFAMP